MGSTFSLLTIIISIFGGLLTGIVLGILLHVYMYVLSAEKKEDFSLMVKKLKTNFAKP